MSIEITKEILCPQCGESQKHQIISIVNLLEETKVKEAILRETFFDWKCRRCSYFAAVAYPFVCINEEAKYAICMNPIGSAGKIKPTEMMNGMRKRLVKNLSEMKEKILIFESGYDDTALELVKNALCTIIKQTYKVNRLHAYFSRENEGELEFAIFLPGKNSAVYHSTKIDVYYQSQEVLKALDYVEPNEFFRVDAKLSRALLEKYQNI